MKKHAFGPVTAGTGAPLPISVANGGTGASTAIAAAQNLGVPFILSQSGIPFISLSSGSVSAVGAISGITALPVAYASAYCYFPANILATVKAAGFYYCTFATTGTGTAFLDPYVSGTPTIPASPTPVTDGKGAFTGDTGEEFGPTITVVGGTMGNNGSLEIPTVWGASPSNANGKTPRIRHSGNAGTIYYNNAMASQLSAAGFVQIANRGISTAQVGHASAAASFSPTGNAATYGTAATASDTTVVFSVQKATATDNLVLERYQIKLCYGA